MSYSTECVPPYILMQKFCWLKRFTPSGIQVAYKPFPPPPPLRISNDPLSVFVLTCQKI